DIATAAKAPLPTGRRDNNDVHLARTRAAQQWAALFFGCRLSAFGARPKAKHDTDFTDSTEDTEKIERATWRICMPRMSNENGAKQDRRIRVIGARRVREIRVVFCG